MILHSQSRAVVAHVPVALEVPEPMIDPVAEVLAGEYEAGFFADGTTVLDIGANVGSFTLWANLRWPGSTIHAYEPHPGTFEMLRRNLAAHGNAILHNLAVFPTEQKQLPFFTRYDGDGESGLADCMARTFVERVPRGRRFMVDVIHPSALPRAEIVKLDVEGAESDILRHMSLDGVELILLEYQDDANRAAIKRHLAHDFVLEHEDEFAWDELLDCADYRPQLAGNHYGRMFFSNRDRRRLRQLAKPQSPGVRSASAVGATRGARPADGGQSASWHDRFSRFLGGRRS